MRFKAGKREEFYIFGTNDASLALFRLRAADHGASPVAIVACFCNLPVGTCLVMQSAPGGAPLGGIQFYNGNKIFVHKNFWESGYFLAYQNGIYGFVDAHYVG